LYRDKLTPRLKSIGYQAPSGNGKEQRMDGRLLVVFAFCLAISITDGILYKIPDILLLSMLAFLLCLDFFCFPAGSLIYPALSSAGLFFIFAAIYHVFGGLGFGDVKFAGVLGYTAGFRLAVYGCLLASLLGIACFIIIKILKLYAHPGTARGGRCAKLPFAPFLSAGVCFMLVLNKAGLV
jgi:prepilin signal peptidase PulO-like enzyme (type II secretory pathway)